MNEVLAERFTFALLILLVSVSLALRRQTRVQTASPAVPAIPVAAPRKAHVPTGLRERPEHRRGIAAPESEGNP